jgi:hypothetical protein
LPIVFGNRHQDWFLQTKQNCNHISQIHRIRFVVNEVEFTTEPPLKLLKGGLFIPSFKIPGAGFEANWQQTGIIFYLLVVMSQAFVKESEEQWLHDIQPTINALIVYLTRENNGIRVYEQRTFPNPKGGGLVYAMSNGLSYSKDEQGKWYILW